MNLISIKNLTISFKQNQNVVNNVNIEIPTKVKLLLLLESLVQEKHYLL
jgi:ABC-type Mn2+/Zn2+ transport system ATPase subunit